MVKIDAFRFYGKNLLFLLFYLVPLLLISCSLPDGLILAEGGKANYFIVIPDEPSIWIRLAVQILSFLKRVSRRRHRPRLLWVMLAAFVSCYLN